MKRVLISKTKISSANFIEKYRNMKSMGIINRRILEKVKNEIIGLINSWNEQEWLIFIF